MKMSLLLSLCTVLALSVGCFDQKSDSKSKQKTSNSIPDKVIDLIKIDQKVGNGAIAESGKMVSVHYTGWLFDSKAADKKGKEFDSSVKRDLPFKFRLGANMVIKGWDQGVAGMKIGGKRQLIIPAKLGYGARDMGPIPAGSTLVFDVELLEVNGSGE